MALLWMRAVNPFRTLSGKGMVVLLAFVTVGVAAMASLGYREIRQATDHHIAIRLDRAARTAAATAGVKYNLTVTRSGNGAIQAYQVARGSVDETLMPNARLDAIAEEIGRVNQGYVSVFRFDPATHQFGRVATTMRGPNGEYVREASFGGLHPAYSSLSAARPFVGEVPQQGRMSMAHVTPILGAQAEVVGAFVVDVGWVDDLWQATSGLRNRMVGWATLILAIVATLGAIILLRAMRPLRVLAQYARKVARNAEAGPVPYLGRSDELGRLAAGVGQVVTMRSRLEQLAYSDVLTGRANRLRFEEVLCRDLENAADLRRHFALILIGIDQFKQINDTFGHAAGDELLRRAANAIGEEIQAGDLLARFSADEFVIIAGACRTQKQAQLLARRCLTRLERPLNIEQGDMHISACAGIVMLPGDATDMPDAVRDASLALHKAKLAGRSQIQFFSSTFNAEAQRRMELQRSLRQALENRELTVYFQPQISCSGNELHGLEALARWPHPDEGMISPAEFVPVAEDTGLIIELGAFVLDEACRTARIWLDSGFDFKRISVNISPIELWQPRFDQMVSATLVKHGLPASYLCLEVTESVFIKRDSAQVRDVLQRLSAIGVGLSLDDFGVGYSSLGYLQSLPFSQLKIDRSFVAKADNDPRKRSLLVGMVALGRGLGMQVVAEGAETAEEVNLVRKLRCDAVQGFYYCAPVNALRVPIEVDRIRRMDKVVETKPNVLRLAN